MLWDPRKGAIFLRLCRFLQQARSPLEGTLVVLKMKALQPLLSCESVPTPAPNLCPCAGGSVVLSAWRRVHESCREPSVPAPCQRAASPGEGDRGVPPGTACPAGCSWALGWSWCPLGLTGSSLGLSTFCTSLVPFPGAPCAPSPSHRGTEPFWRKNF